MASKKNVKKSLTKTRKSPKTRKSVKSPRVKKSVKNVKKSPKKSVKRSRVRKHKYGMSYVRQAAKYLCGGPYQPSCKTKPYIPQPETPVSRRRFIPGVTTPRDDKERQQEKAAKVAKAAAPKTPLVLTDEHIEDVGRPRARRLFLKRILDIYKGKFPVFGDLKKEYIADKEMFKQNPNYNFEFNTGSINIKLVDEKIHTFRFDDIIIKSFFREYNENLKGMTLEQFEEYDKNYILYNYDKNNNPIPNRQLVYIDPYTKQETWYSYTQDRPMYQQRYEDEDEDE